MARLMLSLDGQILAEYNMNKERYTIGRLPDNDIRIDNPAVSGTIVRSGPTSPRLSSAEISERLLLIKCHPPKRVFVYP